MKIFRDLKNLTLKIFHQLNYFQIHLFYFISLTLFGGLLIWGIEKINPQAVYLTYIDSMATAASAACVCGLGIVDFQNISNSAKAIHVVLMFLGNIVLLSVVPVFLKKRYIQKIHKDDLKKENEQFYTYKIEYEALEKLTWIILGYQFVICTLGVLFIVPYSSVNNSVKNILIQNGISNQAWWAFFCVMCAFTQAGFPFIAAGMVPVNTNTLIVLVLCFIMALGNTAYPIALRGIIWFFYKIKKEKVPYKYLLVNSRKCCTHLFPAIQTRVLIVMFIVINTFDMVAFISLDYGRPVLSGANAWGQFLITLFQSINTRTTGFTNLIDLEYTHPAMQWLYIIFMVTASYPFIYSLHQTAILKKKEIDTLQKVYKDDIETEIIERKSFGERVLPKEETKYNKGFFSKIKKMKTIKALQYHFKTMLITDIFWLTLSIFLILIFEAYRIDSDPNFTIFKVIFEVASAYGGVGLTLGYPGANGGFSQVFSQPSKVVMTLILLLGRHRGLPHTLDSAIQLSSPPLEMMPLERKETIPLTEKKEIIPLTEKN